MGIFPPQLHLLYSARTSLRLTPPPFSRYTIFRFPFSAEAIGSPSFPVGRPPLFIDTVNPCFFFGLFFLPLHLIYSGFPDMQIDIGPVSFPLPFSDPFPPGDWPAALQLPLY